MLGMALDAGGHLTHGFRMREVASIMHGVLAATVPDAASKARFHLPEQVRDGARKRAGDLLAAFPLYPEIAL